MGDVGLQEVNLPWTRARRPPEPCTVGGMLLEVLAQGRQLHSDELGIGT